MKKKSDAFKARVQAYNKVEKAAEATPCGKTRPWLLLERKAATDKFDDLYTSILDSFKLVADKATDIALKATLEMEPFYAADKIEEEKLSDIVNCSDAVCLEGGVDAMDQPEGVRR